MSNVEVQQEQAVRIAEIGRKVMQGGIIDREEALFLAHIEGVNRYELFYWANKIRLRFVGEEILLCGIASVHTGQCSENCRFCAQSSHYKTGISPERLNHKEIIDVAHRAKDAGADRIGLVSSGRAPKDKDIDALGPVVADITKEMDCCAALGCLTDEQAERLVSLGVKRYNHNLETSKRFFPEVVTTHDYEDRVSTVKAAQKAGMQVCCGGIFGLGETWDDRVDMAIALRELDVDTVPLNFLNPIDGTPFSENERLSPLEALTIVAMYRFVLPGKHLKVAGGRELCLRDLQSWMFMAGASSTMVGNYLTTTGRKTDDDLQMLKDLEVPFR